jgi:hypothetical protein
MRTWYGNRINDATLAELVAVLIGRGRYGRCRLVAVRSGSGE